MRVLCNAQTGAEQLVLEKGVKNGYVCLRYLEIGYLGRISGKRGEKEKRTGRGREENGEKTGRGRKRTMML